MPYILPNKRNQLPETAGELNYSLTKMVHEYIVNKGGINYSNINEVIGVLECAKQELYRVLAAPYEDEKKNENGHVSELDE